MLNERDLEVADEWIQEHVLEDGVHDFDNAEEDGDTVKYFFNRIADRASVVYLVTVNNGKLVSIKKEVYHEDGEGTHADEAEWIVGKRRQTRKARR